jgi:hypothetical protein
MSYATTQNLADYLYIDVADLPDDAERLLERASELMDYVTLDRIDESITAQAEAAKKAVCAQYEWWAETGDELNVIQMVNSISLGEFSYSTGGQDEQSKIATVAPRAMEYLFLEGLLYRGVNIR